MSPRASLTLAGLVALAAGADLALNGGAGLLFAAKKLADLVEYLSFWR
jgi:hypothetical protein